MRGVRRVLFTTVLALPLIAFPAHAGAPPSPTAVFRGGQAQPVFDPHRAIREDAFVMTPVDSDSDGRNDRVHVHIVRPRATENGLRVPVVFQASPYFAGGNQVTNHDVNRELYVPGGSASSRGTAGPTTDPTRDKRVHLTEIRWEYEKFLLARGYAVVYGESLGTGQSTGCPTVGGRSEVRGARSVVDWLDGRAAAHAPAGRPVRADWSTGNVGMMGVSYNGTLPNAVASTGVPGLKAIVPISAISSWYDYYRANGAIVAPGGYQGEDADVLAKYVYTRQNRQVCQPVLHRIEREQDRLTGDYNAFWDERNYLNNVDNVHAAVLAVHGLNDWNVKTKQAAQWYRALREREVPHKIWWHQYGHVDPIDLRKQAWLHALNRWFTRYLYGIHNGVQKDPRATVQRVDGTWTQQREWPAPGTAEVVLRPTAGGDAQGGLHESGVHAPVVETLRDDARIRAADLASAPRSPNRLAYFTTPVKRHVHINGTVRADLGLAFDRPAANVTALLVDQAPSGDTNIVTRGWADPQNRHALSRTSPVDPGTRYRIAVDLQPDDYILPPGHRLGLVVLSSDHAFTLRPDPGVRLSLDLSHTQLRLPVVGGPSGLS